MANDGHPNVIVLAGPNGFGKSTSAPSLLKGVLGVTEFVNADVLARGLSGFAPMGAALEASRIILQRLHDLAEMRASFAFETTLASKSLAPWLSQLIGEGYGFHLLFLWLPSPEAAMARVRERVRLGGHEVPDETIERRYYAGLRNFFRLYQPLATEWKVFDNSSGSLPRIIACGKRDLTKLILDEAVWTQMETDAK